MRVPLVLSVLALAVPAAAAGPSAHDDGAKACRQSTPSLASQGTRYSGKPLTPQKLTELPPAMVYMAVDRRIGGCEAPLTMVDYRTRSGR